MIAPATREEVIESFKKCGKTQEQAEALVVKLEAEIEKIASNRKENDCD